MRKSRRENEWRDLRAHSLIGPKASAGVDLISDALPFRRLWYENASDAID
jgi:hypothetical protein